MKKKFWLIAIVVSIAFMLVLGKSQGSAISSDPSITIVTLESRTAASSDGVSKVVQFKLPAGITTDGRSLFVVDTFNHTVLKVVTTTGEVITLAGKAGVVGSADGVGAEALFNYPNGITTDGTSLYIADTNNHTIRKVDITTGAVSTIAGRSQTFGSADGTGPDALFDAPQGITTDGTNLYVADALNSTIRKIVISTRIVSTLAGSAGVFGSRDGTGASASFKYPTGLTTDGNSLFVVDNLNHTIRKIIISTGAVTTLAGQSGISGSKDGAGLSAFFFHPHSITMDDSYLYVADAGNSSIRKIDISTGDVTTLRGTVRNPLSLEGNSMTASRGVPYGITMDGTSLYITDTSAILKME